MTLRDLLIGVAVGAGLLAALTLALAVRALVRARRSGRRPGWVGLVFRGVLVAGLVALAAVSLLHAPPPPLVNHPTPAAASDIVAFGPLGASQPGNVVAGISARDGTRRWTWTAPGQVEYLWPGPLGMALAQVVTPSSQPFQLYAIRLSDGAPLWSFRGLNYQMTSPPAQDSARVYVLAGEVSGPAGVVALDAATGAVRWRVPAPLSAAQFTKLAATDGMLALVGAPDSGANRWHVAALRASDGALAWTAESGPPPEAANGSLWMARIAATRDTFFLAPAIGQSVAFDARTGARLWMGDNGATGQTADDPLATLSFAATADTLYLATQPASQRDGSVGPVTLAARDPRTGATRWSQPYTEDGGTALRATDAALLYYGGGWLYGLDPASGARLWRQSAFLTASAPWVSQDGAVLYIQRLETDPNLLHAFTCIFCPEDVWVYAVNPRTSTAWWRARIGSVKTAHVTL
jgi:outer membrane protein assembly factor BamB